ncbi:MAG: phosphoribosylformylglycinamidine synthase subunit PurQ [Desulfuromonadales bacterium]|nr:phosphoribosylformylglycinamidine synthase subunit PurQ [Desulfuromonadales bacterium]
MAEKVKALVIAGNGTNCEREVATACRLAGAECDIVHIAELLTGRVTLERYQFLNLAGGFLDGDDLGSARAGANRLKHAAVRNSSATLADQLLQFIADGKLVMGVCNGFQLMVKLGLLPALDGDYLRQSATLSHNDRGRFEDRWCELVVDPQSPCIYTRHLERLYLPVRHGEGKFIADNATLAAIEGRHLGALRYTDADGRPTMDYPDNPNGSLAAIAGLCDASGRLFGLMPHPEAYTHRTHHPRWTRDPGLPEEGMGLWLYKNAVAFIREELL